MVDFKSSLAKGFSAAKKSEANKAEIESVFKDLNRQLDEATDGKLTIDLVRFYVNSTFSDLANLANLRPRETYRAIAAKNKVVEGCAYKELAKWELGRDGYPCVIILDDDEMYCEDKTSLEENLQCLLSDPVIGEKLYKLMVMKENTEKGEDENEQDI